MHLTADLRRRLSTVALALAIAGSAFLPPLTAQTVAAAPEYSEGVITGLTARGPGGRSGNMTTQAHLETLVRTATGVPQLGLHRGHREIEAVLSTFLGISHDKMHDYMENHGMNLAAVADAEGLEPEDLIDTLTLSFMPFVDKAVANGVIDAGDAADWQARLRDEFSFRIYWEG